MTSEPPDFDEIIERHRERIRDLCRRYAVTGDDVAEVLELAGREVLLRLPATADPEGRFLRAVERRCREHFELHEGEHRRRVLDLLAREEPPAGAEEAGTEQAPGRGGTDAGRCRQREEER